MKANEEQQKVIDAEEDKILVIASASSGKSKTMIECVARRLEEGVEPQEIVVITFTNAAASELYTRLGSKGKNVFIGTIHSYANFLLQNIGVQTSQCIEEGRFDQLFEMITTHKDCILPVNYLYLDEAQDTSKQQFDFILNYIQPKHFMFIGDLRQNIYSFRKGCEVDNFINLMDDPTITVYTLNKNYRNGENILSFAKTIINKLGYPYIDDSEAESLLPGIVDRQDFSEYLLVQKIKEVGNYKDWFVLTRTNAQLDMVYDVLKRTGIPCITFKRSNFDNAEDFKKAMDSDKVKVLTIHTAKGLEAKYVYVYGANMYNQEERRIAYVAATRAKEYLIWAKPPKRGKRRNIIHSWDKN